MNAEAKTAPLAASPTELETRIAAERRRLLLEQNLQIDLESQRLAPLEAGDDEALDRVEVQINSCCDRQARIQERIEILERRLDEATERERNHELDALAAKADQARLLGETLIDGYAQLARPLATVLRKLAAAEELVERANRTLTAAGRPAIASPNRIRCRPYREFDRTVTRRVGIGERLHPHHEDYTSTDGKGGTAYLRNGERCPVFMDVEVVEHITIPMDSVDPLPDTVVLPGIEPSQEDSSSLPIFDGPNRKDIDDDMLREVEAELDDPAIKIAKTQSEVVDGHGRVVRSGKKSRDIRPTEAAE